jgi:hypothetical protein
VWEEREEDGELRQGRRREVAPVDVDDVAQRLEREEGDADRQDRSEQRRRHVHADVRERVLERRGEEVVVLEREEHAEVEHDVPGEQKLAGSAVGRPVHRHRKQLVDDRGRGQQQAEAPVPPAVEDVAGDEHEDPPA